MIRKEYCTVVEVTWQEWRMLSRSPTVWGWHFYITEDMRLPNELGRDADVVYIEDQSWRERQDTNQQGD